MYPAMYVAIMLLIRSRHRDADAAQWLGGGIVGLALAAIGAGLFIPPILAVSSGQIVKDAVNLAYPPGDLPLLAFAVAAISLSGWPPRLNATAEPLPRAADHSPASPSRPQAIGAGFFFLGGGVRASAWLRAARKRCWAPCLVSP